VDLLLFRAGVRWFVDLCSHRRIKYIKRLLKISKGLKNLALISCNIRINCNHVSIAWFMLAQISAIYKSMPLAQIISISLPTKESSSPKFKYKFLYYSKIL
jgi:hypothetical protein